MNPHPKKEMIFDGVYISTEPRMHGKLSGVGAGKPGGGLILFPVVINT